MSLRRRITWLLAMFGLYAVFTAAVAVYGNQWRLERASLELQRIASQTTRVDELELYLMEQLFLLRQLAEGQPQATTPYARVREKWATVLHDALAFSPPSEAMAYASGLRALAEEFETASNRCLEFVNNGRLQDAGRIVDDKLADGIVPQIEQQLVGARLALAEAMNASARGLAATSLQMLALTLGVALLAAVLVTAGAALVHRWLIRPITQLQTAVQHFRRGDLSYRNSLDGSDELGDLGQALNEMARTVSASERKHRTLFSNLRDAVVICDAQGIIQEYHDGDTQILGVEEARHLGRFVLDVWPEWKRTATDWPQVIRSAAEDGRRLRLHDVQLDLGAHGRTGRFADFVIYPVECGEIPCAAVVVRDVTERHQLQDRLRHAETMEALGTMAGGLAHDVSNLLSSVTGTLSVLVNELSEPAQKERIQTALRGCKRAGGLSKRLLDFARGVQGTPQVFAPAEIIDAIVESSDLASSGNISLHRDLDHQLRVQMDPDQFAQIVLNLVRNATDAMPDGGTMTIELTSHSRQHPDHPGQARLFALLLVRDTGKGMSADVEARVFEPFFTTKTRTTGRGRGMGLAIVYAAVKHVGGFVHIESRPEQGTTVQIYLPALPTEPGQFWETRPVENQSA